jgi:hypothetical protein
VIARPINIFTKELNSAHKQTIITKRKRMYHRRYETTSPSARGLINRKKKEEEEVNLSL